jgi:hypothetical protein
MSVVTARTESPESLIRRGPGESSPVWHLLDTNSIWTKEFGSALSRVTPVMGWVRNMSWIGMFRSEVRHERIIDPPLDVCHFPLQRGYTHPVLSGWRFDQLQADRMRSMTGAVNSPLICTTPYYAPVAECWSGPVVYYLTDLTKGYAGADPVLVREMDERMCEVATLVCPNSHRIADYLRHEARCAASKIVVIPNATRHANVFDIMPEGPTELPYDLAGLTRPVAGVIGNLAANLDWVLLRDAINMNPGYSWVFVGPTSMPVTGPAQCQARQELMSRGGKVVFTGERSYGRLRDYARSFDVAVLPYQPRKEPTFSGSSTRFYEHLAACRPMLCTRGFEELLHKEPLLRLVDTAPDITAALSDLRRNGFRDGFEEQRWQASRDGTWEKRAATLLTALDLRLVRTRVAISETA